MAEYGSSSSRTFSNASAMDSARSTSISSAVIVRPEHSRGRCDSIAYMEKAQKALQDDGLDVEWWSEADCITASKSDVASTCFVISDFNSPALASLISLKAKVVGPQVVLTCTSLGRSIPSSRGRPVHNLSMKGCPVACSSLGAKERAAVEAGITTVRPSWVREAWKRSRDDEHFDATDPVFLSQHRLAIFESLVVCTTGYADGDREEIKTLVEENGGRFTGTMRQENCTHLVAKTTSSEKYKVTRSWKIATVDVGWVRESVRRGHCADEDEFKVKAMKASTPTKRGGAPGTLEANCSVIPRTSPNSTMMSESGLTTAVGHASRIGETMLPNREETFRRPMDPPHLVKRPPSRVPTSESDATMVDATPAVFSPIEEFDMTVTSTSGTVIAGCTVCVAGDHWSREASERLKRLITAIGGVRAPRLSAAVTHVIAAPDDVDTIASIVVECTNLMIQPVIVSPDWLKQCFVRSNRLPEAEFTLHAWTNDKGAGDVPSKKRKFGDTRSSSGEQAGPNNQSRSHFGADDPLSQYLDGPGLSDTELLQAAEAALFQVEQPNQAQTSKEPSDIPRTVDQIIAPPPHFDPDAQTVDQMEVDVPPQQPHDYSEEQFPPVFAGLKLLVQGYGQEEDADGVKQRILEAGGDIAADAKNANFIVVPNLNDLSGLPDDVPVVTITWLNDCIVEEQLLDTQKCVLYRPIAGAPLTQEEASKPLSNCVVCMSQFVQGSREAIVGIAEFLGARTATSLSRVSNAEQDATTHLILQEPDGAKFEAAIQWDIPAVAVEWLVQCLKTGKKQPTHPYDIRYFNSQNHAPALGNGAAGKDDVSMEAVDDDKGQGSPQPMGLDLSLEQGIDDADQKAENEPQPITPLSAVPRRLTNGSQRSAKVSIGNAQENVPTPSAFLDPDKPFRFNISMTGIDSPAAAHSPSASEMLPDALVRAASNMANAQYCYGSPSESLSAGMGAGLGLTPGTSKELGCDLGNIALHTPGPRSNVLAGVVIFVSRKLVHQQQQLNNIARSLGGDFRWTYQQQHVTHFVHQGKEGDNTRELRMARSQKKFIVSPAWLHACDKENARVDEMLYPHTFNPERALDVAVTPLRSSRVLEQRNRPSMVQKFDESCSAPEPSACSTPKSSSRLLLPIPPLIEAERVEQPANVVNPALSDGADRPIDAVDDRSSVETQLPTESEQQLAELNMEIDEVVTKAITDNAKSPPASGRLSFRSGSTTSTRSKANRTRATGGTGSKLFDSSRNQTGSSSRNGVVVGWADEEQMEERQKIGGLRKPANQLTQSYQADSPANDDKDSNHRSRMARFFQLTGIPRELRAEQTSLIEELGGEVEDQSSSTLFSPRCTHMIAYKVQRNEKVLAAIATGCWLLHPSYLAASQEAGKFVNEEEYEWGSSRLKPVADEAARATGPSRQLISCSPRWRRKLSNGDTRGAYAGWKVCLVFGAEKAARSVAFARILEHAGATLFENVDNEVTHVITDETIVNKNELKVIKRLRIPCYTLEYLPAFLADEDCDPTPYLVKISR